MLLIFSNLSKIYLASEVLCPEGKGRDFASLGQTEARSTLICADHSSAYRPATLTGGLVNDDR